MPIDLLIEAPLGDSRNLIEVLFSNSFFKRYQDEIYATIPIKELRGLISPAEIVYVTSLNRKEVIDELQRIAAHFITNHPEEADYVSRRTAAVSKCLQQTEFDDSVEACIC